jgi:hypothetical protein
MSDTPAASMTPDYGDSELYPFDEGMKAQCRFIIWWQQCRLDHGHEGMHSPGRLPARDAPPLRSVLERYGRHDDSCSEWPEQNQPCDCGFADAYEKVTE